MIGQGASNLIRKSFLPLFFCLFFLQTADLFAWVNGSFQTGDTTGWTVNTNVGTAVYQNPAVTVVGVGPATLTNGNLPEVEPGNTYAAELFSGYGDPDHEDWASLSQSDTVPANQTVLTVWFAAVLEGAHYLEEDVENSDSVVQFTIQVAGNTVYTQPYSWYADYPPAAVTPLLFPPVYPVTLVWDDVVSIDPLTGGSVTWAHLPWTQYAYDFSAYVGQQVTINYTAYDCSGDAHWCYGYLDAAAWNNSSGVSNVTPVPCQVGSGATCTPTATPTITLTPTPLNTPTITLTPTATLTPTSTFTATPTCVILLWPDPFNPKYAFNQTLKISCIPSGGTALIFTVSGEFVRQVPESGGMAQWDGLNQNGSPASNGIYFYVVQMGSKVLQEGKFLLIRN